MQFETKFFGNMEYTEKEILQFKNGLFGFEAEKQFVLIYFDDENHDLLCLQSIKTPELAFVLMNPFSLDPNYHPQPADSDWKAVDAAKEEDINYYVICVVRETSGASTINMKCPVIINPANNAGRQIILDQPEYGLKHALSSYEKKEG